MRSIWIKLALCALVAVGVLATSASATHFRYGNQTWVNTGGTSTEFTITNAFRRSGYVGTGLDGQPVPGDVINEFIGLTSFNFGDATGTPTLSYVVTSIDIANNWLFAVALDPASLPAQDTTIEHTYAAAGNVTAFTAGCCRLSTLINAPDFPYQVETIVNVGGSNHPPVSTMPPIVNCPIDALCTFQVPANDADADGLAYRLSTQAESGIATQPGPPVATNAASISASGLYTWDTTGATLAGVGFPTHYATQVTIEDRTTGNVTKSKIAVDFIIQLVEQVGTPPTFDFPTPTCGSTVNATVGNQVSFSVAASDADANDAVTLTAAGVPVGALLNPSLPAMGNPVSTDFAWTPAGAGSSVVVFAATDTSGNQVLCSVTIDVTQAPLTAMVTVTKFYDADADGEQGPGEPDIVGWKVQVSNGVDPAQVGTTQFTAAGLAPGLWTTSEFSPIQANWHATTPTSFQQTLVGGDDKTVSFGNVCTGDGGGLTIGFWGNKNGQALFGADDLALLVSLNLRNADGTAFNPASYAAFKTWLSKATATNMAYMLSAQLAAMELNVLNGKVDGSAYVYAPNTISANPNGFALVSHLMTEANFELNLHGLTKSGSQFRSYQNMLKDVLDQANQDQSTIYAQSAPCSFSFAP